MEREAGGRSHGKKAYHKETRMKLYIGNLSYETTEEDLKTALEPFGTVDTVTIIKDRGTGQSKGFAFAEMDSQSEGQSAIQGLNGKELNGRALNVSEARPRVERPDFKKGFGGPGGFGDDRGKRGGGPGGYGGRGGYGGGRGGGGRGR
jgi:RNA recognition motif-containing protein